MTTAVEIEGLIVTELRQMPNPSGDVLHMLRGEIVQGIAEVYFSEVLPRAVKDWRRHRLQTQNIAVPVGRIQMAIFDDRESSSTRGRFQLFEMGRPNAYFRLRIPPLIWYSFGCLSTTPALLATGVDMPHDPSESDKRPWDDSSFPHRWTPCLNAPH